MQLGDRVGDYRLLREVGKGSFGVVCSLRRRTSSTTGAGAEVPSIAWQRSAMMERGGTKPTIRAVSSDPRHRQPQLHHQRHRRPFRADPDARACLGADTYGARGGGPSRLGSAEED